MILQKYNRTRETLKEYFLEALTEPMGLWEKEWRTIDMVNKDGIPYRGINKIVLSLTAIKKGYTDNRWFTYNNCQNFGVDGKKAYIKKGETAVYVEYWYCVLKKPKDMSQDDFDMILNNSNEYLKRAPKNNRFSFAEIDTLKKEIDGLEECVVKPTVKNIPVYNANQIENLIPNKMLVNNVKNNDMAYKVLQSYMKNENITYKEDFSDKAYYVPSKDFIHLPNRIQFKDYGGYIATMAHEIAHSTGTKARLNRNIETEFGSKSYALEELNAELSAVFITGEFGTYIDTDELEEHLNNHKTYVQNWLKIIKGKNGSDILASSFLEADKIVSYVKAHSDYKKMIDENKYEFLEKIIGDIKMEENNLKMRDTLTYFALKYNGDFNKIYEAVLTKEPVDTKIAQQELEKIDCKVTTLLDEDYPNLFKREYMKPPFVIFHNSDTKVLDDIVWDNFFEEKVLNDETRLFTTLELASEKGSVFVGCENYHQLEKMEKMAIKNGFDLYKGENKKIEDYILLNSKSALNCDDLDDVKHIQENTTIMNKLSTYAHCECNVNIQSKNDSVNNNLKCTLSYAINELPQYFDLKQGADFKLTSNGDLVISCFGEEYSIGGKDGVIQNDLIIKANNKEGKHIDFKEVLLQKHKEKALTIHKALHKKR